MPIIAAVFIFSGFEKLHVKYNRVVNYIAGATFGIYLFHEDISFKYFMWNRIFKTDEIVQSKFLFLYIPLIIVLIFLVGILIEYIRKSLFEKPFLKLIEKIEKSKGE